MADPVQDTSAAAKPGKRNYGCLVFFCLTGIVELSAGLYLMGRWDTAGLPMRLLSLVLTVMGIMSLLPVVFGLAVLFAARFFLRKIKKELGEAAGGLTSAAR